MPAMAQSIVIRGKTGAVETGTCDQVEIRLYSDGSRRYCPTVGGTWQDITDASFIDVDQDGNPEISVDSDNNEINIDANSDGTPDCVFTTTGISCNAHATAGGAILLKEGIDDGTNTWSIKVPDSGLGSTVQCVLTAGGKIPLSCLVQQSQRECFTLYDTDGLADTNDVGVFWSAPAAAITVTGVTCRSDHATGSSFTLTDESANDLTTGCAVCDNATAINTNTCTLTGNTAYTAGEGMSFAMGTAAGNLLTFCVSYTYD